MNTNPRPETRAPFVTAPQLHVVVGGQFGSEAKGHVTQDVCERLSQSHPIISVRVAGPNAGHIVYVGEEKFAMRQIPVGFSITSPPHTQPHPNSHLLYIASGSEVDPSVLEEELEQLNSNPITRPWIQHLFISPRATLLEYAHKEQEGKSRLNDRLGSTAKGIGAARVDRLNRTATTVGKSISIAALQRRFGFRVEELSLPDFLASHSVVIEGTQGYGLGLHTKFYPFTTSSDCRATDFLAMAGVSAWDVDPRQFVVDLVVRPYPIRVAGNSGPLEGETTWGELGLPEEQTTVTKKTRRVGQFDGELVRAAIEANGASRVALHLSMGDQIDDTLREVAGTYTLAPIIAKWPKIGGWISDNLALLAGRTGLGLVWIGTGPRSHITVSNPPFDPQRWAATNPKVPVDVSVGFETPTGQVYIQDASGAQLPIGTVVGTIESGLKSVKTLMEEITGVKLGNVPSPAPWQEDTETGQWLYAYIDREVGVMLQKAAEYGSVELIEAGRTLSSIMSIDDIPDSWAAENQIYMYVTGKLGRWTAAMRRGEQVSQDTIHDIFVYCLMVLKLRETGEWA